MYAIKIQAKKTYYYEAFSIVKRELKFKNTGEFVEESKKSTIEIGYHEVINSPYLTGENNTTKSQVVIELMLCGKDVLTFWVFMPAKIFIMQDGKTIEVIQ